MIYDCKSYWSFKTLKKSSSLVKKRKRNEFLLVLYTFQIVVFLYDCFCFKIRLKLTIFDIPEKQKEIVNYIKFNLKKAKYLPVQKAKFIYHQPFYFEYNLDEDMNPLAYVGNNFSCDIMTVFADTFFSEGVDIYMLKNGYIGNYLILGTSKNELIDMFGVKKISKHENVFIYKKIKKQNFTNKIGYRYVLAPVFRYGHIFAHWITDVICPLQYVPQWIWDLNPVICLQQANIEIAKEYLDIIGHKNIKINILEKGEVVYGEYLFIVKGLGVVHPCGKFGLPSLKNKIQKYYKLDSIKPQNYGYMNKTETRRSFTNLDELIYIIEKEYKITFKFLKINYPNRSLFAREVASLKILICPCGSIAYNIIFMKNSTGLLTLNANVLDGPNLKAALELNLWHIQVIHDYLTHFAKKPGECNITRCIMSFKTLFKAVHNKKWPSNNFFTPINFSYFKKLLKYPYNHKFLLKVKHMKPLYKCYMNYIEIIKRK